MAKIILIECSTALCSTALSIDGKIVEYRESSEIKAHASLTAVFIQEMLQSQGLSVSDCDAVCLSSGPGSYTGLRVGASTAKGLCFGANIPLLSVGTLDVLAAEAIACGASISGIIPLIDARRMEVYTAVYSSSGERLTDISAKIIEEGAFSEELSKGKVVFIGDGVDKCKEILGCENSIFIQTNPKASSMATLAEKEYAEKNFKDIAYFEPFYLKQFTATVSKKKLF